MESVALQKRLRIAIWRGRIQSSNIMNYEEVKLNQIDANQIEDMQRDMIQLVQDIKNKNFDGATWYF